LTYTPTYRCIFTSTDQRKDSAKDKAELEEFQSLKKHFMGQDKALIIKLNHDVNQVQSLFERVNHLYVMTEANLDKYILLFSFVKLAIVQGKTVVMCNDII
jgi:hypothetical protein